MIELINKASIEVTDLEISLNGLSDRQLSQLDQIGWLPYLQYRGTPIESGQIQYYNLDSSGFIPTLEVIISDYNQGMRSSNFALDNDIISTYISSRNSSLTDIKMDFKIIDYNFIHDNSGIYIKGICNVDELYVEEQYSMSNKTSFDALSEIASKLKLGYASNITSTDDEMTWINPGDKNYNFIQDIVSRSFKDETAFFWSYVDVYYNLIFVNVEIEMEFDSSKNVGAIDSGLPLESIEHTKETTTDLTLIYGQNVQNYSNMQFSEYEIFNQSTKQSLNEGYVKNVQFYDRAGNWDKHAGIFYDISLETSQAPSIANQNIILKSQPDDTTKFLKLNQRWQYTGKLDRDNVHGNFLYAQMQNKFNIEEIQKIYIIITLPTPNFNLHKFMKVKLMFHDVASPVADKFINMRLSGAWLITGISFEISTGIFKQKVTLCRRELTVENYDV